MRTGRRDFVRLSLLAGVGASLPSGCASPTIGAEGLVVGLAASPRAFDGRGRCWSLLPSQGALEVLDGDTRVLHVDTLAHPDALAVTDDAAWVVERESHTLARVSLDGRITRHGVDVLRGPRDVALDANGSVLVADTLAHRVHRFDAAGALVASYGEPGPDEGQLNGPRALAVDGDTLVIAEIGGRRVTRLDRSGAWLETIARETGEPDTGELETGELETIAFGIRRGLIAPRALRIGPDGRIAVGDLVADEVVVFARDGSIARFVPEVRPESLAFAPDGTLWVCGDERT